MYEKVYTVTVFHDDIREGIADFEGQHHFFRSEWDDEADDYADTFTLSPVDDQLLLLAVEDREIERRWWTAYYNGQATEETGRVFPEDRERHDEIQRILRDRLKIDPQSCIRTYGDFRRDPNWCGKIFPPLEVRWTRV